MKALTKFGLLLSLLLLNCFSIAVRADGLDPRFYFFMNGNVVGARGWQIADPKNWSVNLTGKSGQSDGGKLIVSPENYQGSDDAFHLEFTRQNMRGQFSLYGESVDLSSVKDTAALVVDLKLAKNPNKPVTVGMDCGYPCRAEVRVDKQLKKSPKNQWFTFPIPLNCFAGQDFDLSKINGPFFIATEGKLDISIANIRIALLPEGEKGCAAN